MSQSGSTSGTKQGGDKMALIWFDGFNYNTDAAMLQVEGVTACSGISFGTAYGRRDGSRGIDFDHYSDELRYDLSALRGGIYDDTDHTTIILGFAFKPTNAGAAIVESTRFLCRITPNVQIHLFTGNVIKVVMQDTSAVIATGTEVLNVGQWNFLEFKILFNETTGAIYSRVNSVNDISSTGLNTVAATGGIVGCSEIWFCNNNTSGALADLWICNSQGSIRNDYLGDLRVDPITVTGDGSNTDFTPSAGSNYENVDEDLDDTGDADYNESGTVTNKDTYELDSLSSPSGTTIFGLKTEICVKKDDVGARSIKPIVRAGTTDYQGTERSITDDYITYNEVYEKNPDDSADWEDADINAVEIDVEDTA